AFTAAEVAQLHRAAVESGDQQLGDLIALGMFTGCRIEELCALPIDKVMGDHIEIEDAKTDAGWRKVPVHSEIRATVARLVRDSSDGFLLSGLAPNKYGDRSARIGKRFGHLKTRLGYEEPHVFHSIRKTVTTLLENAGVVVNVIDDLLGW